MTDVKAKHLDYLRDSDLGDFKDLDMNGLVFGIRNHEGKWLVNRGSQLTFTNNFHPGINGWLITRVPSPNGFDDMFTFQSLYKFNKNYPDEESLDAILDIITLDPVSPVYRAIKRKIWW